MTKWLIALGVLLTVGSLQAQQLTWTGGSSTNWQDPANWSGANVPDAAGEYAYFNYGTVPTANPLLLNGDVTLGVTTSATYASFLYAQGNVAMTVSGANTPNNTLTLQTNNHGNAIQVNGGGVGQTPTLTFEKMNIVFNNAVGGANKFTVGRNGVLTFASTTTMQLNNGSVLEVVKGNSADAPTVNINSATLNAGSGTNSLTIAQGRVNWGVTSFVTTATTPTIRVQGQDVSGVSAPAQINFTSNYSSGTTSGMILAGLSTTNSNAIVTAAHGITVTDAVQVNGSGTATSSNNVTVGVTDVSSTATFGGVHIYQSDVAGNVSTLAFVAATNSTAVISGAVQGWRNGGTMISQATLSKKGAGTVIFAGNDTDIWHNGNYVSSGAFDIQEGKLVLKSTASYANASAMYINSIVRNGATLELGASNQITNTASLTLNGGTFDANNFAETLGELIVSANSFLSIDAGALLAFGSSQSDWGANTLNITGTLDAQGIRFGTDATGLLAGNMDNILYNGQAGLVSIDSSGYLTAVPEPSSVALLVASVCSLGWVLRRRGTVSI